MLCTVPLTIGRANDVVNALHRHHPPTPGGLFALGVMDAAGALRGAAIVAHPVARMLSDGWTCEVRRVATDGADNACSMLLGSAWRAARALGYRRCVTYTLDVEGGASLRGAGWTVGGHVAGAEWSSPARPRKPASAAQLLDKVRWQVQTADYDGAPAVPDVPRAESRQLELLARV